MLILRLFLRLARSPEATIDAVLQLLEQARATKMLADLFRKKPDVWYFHRIDVWYNTTYIYNKNKLNVGK